jgi:hypothetical protein
VRTCRPAVSVRRPPQRGALPALPINAFEPGHCTLAIAKFDPGMYEVVKVFAGPSKSRADP